ncbi:hypothetical protein D3C80_2233120 [compost metagenome]
MPNIRSVVSSIYQWAGSCTTPIVKITPPSRIYPSQLVVMLSEKMRVMVLPGRPRRE